MTRAIAIGFVVYNPEEKLLDRIRLAIESDFHVYVFDNSPHRVEVRAFTQNEAKVKYFTCGKNLGLGLGISFVCAQAYYENYLALVFFDQDSVFSEDTLNFIEKFYLNRPELEATHSAVVFSARDSDSSHGQDCYKDVPLAINSGSLFYLKNLKALNWHNEKYFVDCVDYEFCLRSKKAGLRIAECSCTPGFDHSTEQADQKYRIFGKNYSMRPYAFSRIIDSSKGSLKLISAAAFGGDLRFAAKIAKLFFIYAATQVLVRCLKLADRKKRVA